MTLQEFSRKSNQSLDYCITATDISGRMLKKVNEAIYPIDLVADVPQEIKHRYFLKSKSSIDPTVRVVKEIRARVKPAYLNLMSQSYPYAQPYDIVFLRNTLIYFDLKTQNEVVAKVLSCMKPGGYLFIGHSESLINMNLPIQSVAPSVYVKTSPTMG